MTTYFGLFIGAISVVSMAEAFGFILDVNVAKVLAITLFCSVAFYVGGLIGEAFDRGSADFVSGFLPGAVAGLILVM